jgi:hypothetical protein
MNERQWQLYRLSVVERWSESPYKKAVSASIEHKLRALRQHPAAGEQAESTLDIQPVKGSYLPSLAA